MHRNVIKGTIEMPGDKSISHRALIIGALAKGKTTIKNLLICDDTIRTMDILKKLGVKIGRKNNCFVVHGNGLKPLKKPNSALDAGGSATTARLILGILAGKPFESTIKGDKVLSKRPMLRVVEPLRRMGAEINGKNNENYLPLTVKGENLKAIKYELPIASAQIKSAILLAGLFAKGETTIIEKFSSRDHTERILRFFNAPIFINGRTMKIKGKQEFKGKKIIIPGDISSAAFFIVAASLIKSSNLTIKRVGVNPTRTGILDVLKNMGANIKLTNKVTYSNEPFADIKIKSANLHGTRIDASLIPRLIDEIPIIAVAACFADGTTLIKNAAELRMKESDRIKAIVSELNKLGADIKELSDGMMIKGPCGFKSGKVNSHNDHRIAMALSIAGLVSEKSIYIKGMECVSKSFPNFNKKNAVFIRKSFN